MSKETLEHRIDFMLIVSADHANPNGDPTMGGRPRTDWQEYGEISAECIKRKLRNRMQDMGNEILYQARGRETDGFRSVEARVEAVRAELKPEETLHDALCERFADVRAFGAVIAYSTKKTKDAPSKGISEPIHGPVTITMARSVDPVVVREIGITKSLNGSETEKAGDRASDTMGKKHVVDFGVYIIKGSINALLAEKTGFTNEDAEAIKQALATLFDNDESSSRPAGSMCVERLYWCEHSNKNGNQPPHEVHRAVKVVKLDPKKDPISIEDYEISLNIAALRPGVTAETI